MTRIREAWNRVKTVQRKKQPPFRPDLAHTYEGGKAWLGPVLLRHGLSQADIDELGVIEEENFNASFANVLEMMNEGAVSPTYAMHIMHAAGMSNGVALGLTAATIIRA